MKKLLLAGLMTATALMPIASASAEPDRGRGQWNGGGDRGGQGGGQRDGGGQRGGGGGGGQQWGGGDRGGQRDGGQRGGGGQGGQWNGGGGGQGGGGQGAPQFQPRPSMAPPPAQLDRGQFDAARRGGGQGRPDRGGFGNGRGSDQVDRFGGNRGPGNGGPGAGRPDGGRPDNGRPAGGWDNGRPGAGRPDNGRPGGWDNGRPGAGRPDNGRPGGWDNGRPGAGRPDNGRPGGWDNDRPGRGRPDGNYRPGQRYGDWRDNSRYRQGWDDRRGWSNGWRGDRRYDWRGYRSYNRDIYRLPRYYAPSGWGYGYRRFSIGYILTSLLFSPQYWIDDPYYYRLPDAYGPYRWVRYYDDALLVDMRTGQVVDVVYDIFW